MAIQTSPEAINWVRFAALLSAGICMGFGAIGPALGQGLTGSKACEAISKKPESSGLITRTMITALAFIESSAIYSFVIALILIFLT
jgi:F-type H+-transporting ATPase subunit c